MEISWKINFWEFQEMGGPDSDIRYGNLFTRIGENLITRIGETLVANYTTDTLLGLGKP